MNTLPSPNTGLPSWQDRLSSATEVTMQVLGSVLTAFGAIIFVVAMFMLWINSLIHSQNRLPPDAQSAMVGVFLFSGNLIIPGWALMSIGFGLFPLRGPLFKTPGRTGE